MRRLAVAVFIFAAALSLPGIAFAKWGLNSTGTAYGRALASIPAPTGVTPTSVNSSGGTNGTHCVGGNSHLTYVNVAWSGPATTYTGETYTITWTEASGGSNGASGSASVSGSGATVQVKSANASVSYTFVVTSVLHNWTTDSTASSALSTPNC